MRPYIICHMVLSVDGKIDGAALGAVTSEGEYEATAARLNGECLDFWSQRRCSRTLQKILENLGSGFRRADIRVFRTRKSGFGALLFDHETFSPFVGPWLSATDSLRPNPPAVIPAGVGVNIHFVTGHARDLDLITNAGFRIVRMDFSWEATERKAGVYDWTEYDELTAHLEQRGLRALYILDYVNGLYEPMVDARRAVGEPAPEKHVASPRHPESVAAFARWAAAAAVHFRGRHVLWEIYNEPNGGFWRPKPDATEYTTLALATARAIREAELPPPSSPRPCQGRLEIYGDFPAIGRAGISGWRQCSSLPRSQSASGNRRHGLQEAARTD